MPTYKATLICTLHQDIEVEAKDEDQAQQMMLERFSRLGAESSPIDFHGFELVSDDEIDQGLIDEVIEAIKSDVEDGDVTAVAELLSHIPEGSLAAYLPDAVEIDGLSIEEVADLVLDQIKTDCSDGDVTAIEELLKAAPADALRGFLPEVHQSSAHRP